MSDRAPYSRVYWEIADDPKFAAVFDNDANLAAWLRLLLIADQAYPSSGHLPMNVRKSAVLALEEARLIERHGSRFTLLGLKREREARKSAATRDPRGTQLGPKRDPVGSLDKTSPNETSRGQAETRDPADIYWQLTGRFPTDKALSWIDNLAEQYGAEATVEALAKAHIESPATQTILSRTRDRLASKARELDRAEQAAEKQRLREKRAQPRVEQPWLAEYRAMIEKQYGDAA